ncbi:glycosyltransferase family 2 protein [Paenibacillus gallinarum]|uniref:Glycosyltransferase n=1 Tax=Paenibacillus gallinarum TaxID=2762232 RepID=A0ABR8SZG0_9BACL|nr:glycosyltransferase [Paenibacillus gallinarum]MBD7968898.1 glycosyltransferase [Paenibacillus gallinarum]
MGRALRFLKRKGFKSFLLRSYEQIKFFKIKNLVFDSDFIISDKERIIQENTHFGFNPKVSIVVPVFNTQPNFLIEMIESVLNQTYRNLELCIFNGGSSDLKVKEVLDYYISKDNRIKVSEGINNGGISSNTNKALSMATGEYVALLDHDDIIAPNAIFENVKAINLYDKAPDLLYSDEDKITENGLTHVEPHKKPDWSPDTLLSYNYICHLLVFKSDLLKVTGNLNSKFDGSQDYDFILRLTQKANNIVHIPKILYHWRISNTSTALNYSVKSEALENGKKALEEYLEKQNTKAKVFPMDFSGSYNVIYEKTSIQQDLAIIVRGTWINRQEIEGYIFDLQNSFSINNNFQKVFLFNESNMEKIIFDINVEVIGVKDLNFAQALNNLIKRINTEYIILIDSNIKAIKSDLPERLISHLNREDIAVVGGKLLKGNKKIHSYGYAVTKKNIYNIFKGFHNQFYGYFGRLKICQNVTAVSPELVIFKRSSLIEVGYFNEVYENYISFVEYCYKLKDLGKKVKLIPLDLGIIESEPDYMKPNLKEIDKFLKYNRGILSDRDKYFPEEILEIVMEVQR